MGIREDQVFEAVVRKLADEYVEMESGGPAKRYPPATAEVVAEAEQIAGRPLPYLLKRLYTEVGNGGFGPGYGLLGLRGGHKTGQIDATVGLRHGSLMLCDWGCGISSDLHLDDGQVWGYDPNGFDAAEAFPQHMTVVDWFAKWAEGRLYQPWLVQDPATGELRGATDEEYEEMIAEGE
ncbi:hypothetical protein [Actinoplanes sp. NPDC049802]|uniref:hypothetical protein n=1 Tax=Actinoplanes sp. NPDC049802 TaxID=3154742 RepID=UPI0033D6AF3E